MHVLISGASGMIGSALAQDLTAGGHTVVRLVRPPNTTAEHHVLWDPEQGKLDPKALGEVDAVVHLAGENIADGRWDAAKKQRIRESRVNGTRLLAETLAELDVKPEVFLSGSAIGYYGSRGGELLHEYSDPGHDFLAEVCQAWEAAAAPAREAGIRTVPLRIAMVLSTQGGALKKMLPIFKAGIGGRIGNGKQYWSWVHIDDVVGAIRHVIDTPALTGPVNVASPQPLENRDFTKTFGRVLFRPTILPLPAPIARLQLGEMASALLLPSQRVEPERLKQTRYEFRHPELEGALRDLLKRG